MEWEADFKGDSLKNANEILDRYRQMKEEQRAILEKEKSKKKKDEDAIKEEEKEYEDISMEYLDKWKELRDSIVGSAIDIANTLGDAFFDAFAEGENAARAWKKSVKQIVADAVKNAIYTRYLMPKIDAIMSEYLGGEGEINDLTQIDFLGMQGKLNDLGNEVAIMTNALQQAFQDLLAGVGDNSLTSGIQGVTEDTASIIASYMNSVRDALLIQSGHVKDISVAVLSINENYLPNIQTHLLSISTNTGSMNQQMQQMLSDFRAIINGTKKIHVA